MESSSFPRERPGTRFSLALLGAGGSLFLALSCQTDASPNGSPVVDSGAYDAGRPARDASAVRDAGEPTDGGGNGCPLHAGWSVAHPFQSTCTVQLAPPERLAEAALPLRPCNNGQANCQELGIPPSLTRGIPDVQFVPEGDSFFLIFDDAEGTNNCRQAHSVRPTANGYVLGGASAINLFGNCGARGNPASPDIAFTADQKADRGRSASVILTPWTSYSPILDLPVGTEFTSARRSGNTLYAYEESPTMHQIIDIPSKRIVATVRPPASLYNFIARFAFDGDLWATNDFGLYNKSEYWRLDPSGTYSPMLRKQGAHIFGARTDGTTLFWIEASGNEADFFPQPKIEIWSAPFSKNAATIQATKRLLRDISGVEDARDAIAHDGFYAVKAGEKRVIVVRARDGAEQRISLDGEWGGAEPAFVNATQVWFQHGAINPRNGGVARVMLQPWP